jgi:hypothetical protein
MRIGPQGLSYVKGLFFGFCFQYIAKYLAVAGRMLMVVNQYYRKKLYMI